ncbi:MAG: protein kinase [Planctomycetota bacterium]
MTDPNSEPTRDADADLTAPTLEAAANAAAAKDAQIGGVGSHETTGLEMSFGDPDVTRDQPTTQDAAAGTPKPHLKQAADAKVEATTERMLEKQFPNFEIQSVLGKGGMGIVFLARDQKLGRRVAVKTILGSSLDEGRRRRFEREARAVASLQHPNFVQLHEYGISDDRPFFVLEYVDGGTLGDQIRESPLPPRRAAEILEICARAMHTAHQNGLLHRDLKPANILVTADGVPKISDFGLAKDLVGEANSDANDEDTRTGMVIGTPSYMSPEQARGQSDRRSGSTDQYALGAVLYACLTGRPPFHSSSALDTLSEVVNQEPVSPKQLDSNIPIDLETIVLKTLEKNPEQRYANCEALADDLARFLRDEPIVARPISRWEHLARWCKRNPLVAAPTGLAAALVMLVALVSSWAWATTSAQAAVIQQEKENVTKQRDEADRQRILANEQKLLAEQNEETAITQAKLALNNIQFIVTQVDDQLMNLPGASETRIGMLEMVSDQFDKLDKDLVGGLKGQAYPTFMGVRYRVAQSLEKLDRLDEAVQEYQKVEKMSRERFEVKGRNDATRLNLARILTRSSTSVGRVQGGPAALRQYAEASELIDDILNNPKPQPDSPSKDTILAVKAEVQQNYATELMRNGSLSEALQRYQDATGQYLQFMEGVRSADGFDDLPPVQKVVRQFAHQTGRDKGRLGMAYVKLRMGETDAAIDLYDAAIKSQREVQMVLPTNNTVRSVVGGMLMLKGKAMMWLGELAKADKLLDEATQLCTAAYEADPKNANYRRALCESNRLHSSVLKLMSRTEESIAKMERSRLNAAALFEATPDTKNAIYLMMAEAHLGNQDATIAMAKPVQKDNPNDAERHLECGRALAELAITLTGEKRQHINTQAIDVVAKAIQLGYQDPYRLTHEPEFRELQTNEAFKSLIKDLSKTAAAGLQ